MFGNRNAFGKPQIHLPGPGTSQEIAGDIAEAWEAEPRGADTTRVKRVGSPGSAKSRGVEIPAGQIQRLAGNEVGTLLVGVSVRASTH